MTRQAGWAAWQGKLPRRGARGRLGQSAPASVPKRTRRLVSRRDARLREPDACAHARWAFIARCFGPAGTRGLSVRHLVSPCVPPACPRLAWARLCARINAAVMPGRRSRGGLRAPIFLLPLLSSAASRASRARSVARKRTFTMSSGSHLTKEFFELIKVSRNMPHRTHVPNNHDLHLAATASPTSRPARWPVLGHW